MSEENVNDLPLAEPVVESDALDTAFEQAYEQDERTRDERGRFAAAQKEKEAEASNEPAPAAVTDPNAPPVAVEPALVQPIEAPARWTEADKAKFAAWPRETQEAVLERHKAMEADYTRKSQDIAEFRKSAEPLVQAVQPYQQYLDQLAPTLGMSPPQMVNAMLGFDYRARSGTPEQKVAALAELASSYGIDLAAMSRGEGAQPNPLIDNLRQTVSQLTQRVTQFETQHEQQTVQQISNEITAFENAKNADGSPKYPHYQRVRGIMGNLIGQDGGLSLEQAYESATAPIREAVEAELGKRQKSADEMNSEAVAKARRATPVRTSGTQPNGSAKAQTLDSILDDNLTAAGFH